MSTTAPPRPKTGTKRLSEVARHLVAPTGITRTYWNAVRDQCVDLGLGFDRWQDGSGRLILAQRASGRFAAGIGGVHLSWPRQVGKTYLIGAIVIALCLLRPGMLALWTAHHGKTINETFRAMQAMARRSKIFPHVSKIITGNGDEAIEFRNGSRILFGAREHGFGLGFSKVSLLVFDEAQRVTQRAITDMVPTTNAGINPLVFYIGTPPRPEDRGEVFTVRRKKALVIEAARAAGEDPRYNALYIELSADRTANRESIDWDQIGKANPSYPHRVDADAIERMWEQLGSEDFWREGYGIWDDDAGTKVFDPSDWAACSRLERPHGLALGYLGVAVTMDLTAATIVGAGALENEQWVKPLQHGPGTGWLIDRCVQLQNLHRAPVVVDGRGPAAVFIPHLERAGVQVVTATTANYLDACAGLDTAVREQTLRHVESPELDAAVDGAKRRDVGERWAWGRKKSESNIAPLEAATLAVWALEEGGGPSVYEDETVPMTFVR